MSPITLQLQRIFWSLYGRFVWDEYKAPSKSSNVGQIVEILTTRRTSSSEKVLDAGCGTGLYAIALAYAGFHVTGIDYAPGMLARAQAKVTDALATSLSFQQMDLNKRLKFPASSFDHAICISVLQAVPNPTFTLGELWRVLKPGGTLVLLLPCKSTLPLQDVIRRRITNLSNKTLFRMAMVVVKSCAERTKLARYWTPAELREMLQINKYKVLTLDHGPPIIVVAEK
jgi:ubiquinone/menaquinone biosynthesis C-methylase UbiE